MSQPIKKLRIDSAAKETIATRTDAAKIVGTNGPASILWKTKPSVATAGTGLTIIGAALADADAAVKAAENKLVVLREVRDTKVVDFDAAFDVYATSISQEATTPKDVADAGLTVLDRSTHALAPPISLDVTFDVLTSQIVIHVERAPGLRNCIVEVSPDPVGPTTWKRLRGLGVLKKLGDCTPGMYWVRAASARADDESDFTVPVSVIVK